MFNKSFSRGLSSVPLAFNKVGSVVRSDTGDKTCFGGKRGGDSFGCGPPIGCFLGGGLPWNVWGGACVGADGRPTNWVAGRLVLGSRGGGESPGRLETEDFPPLKS